MSNMLRLSNPSEVTPDTQLKPAIQLPILRALGRPIAAMFVAAALVACGGGGGGSSLPTDGTANPGEIGSPATFNDIVSTSENTPVVIDVLSDNQGSNPAALQLAIVGAPANGTAVVQADNTISYVPNPGYQGEDSISYRVMDADGGISIASVEIQVTCASCGPEKIINLAWDPNPGTVTGYRVYYGQSANKTDKQISDLLLASNPSSATAPAVTYRAIGELGLHQGDQVCFRIKAYLGPALSDFSDAACTVL